MSAYEHINEHVKNLYKSLHSEHPDVKLGLMAFPSNIHLDTLIVPEEKRGQGIGSSIVNRVTQTADTLGVSTTVSPSTNFGTDRRTLTRFYKKHGFSPRYGSNKDMIRRPQQ